MTIFAAVKIIADSMEKLKIFSLLSLLLVMFSCESDEAVQERITLAYLQNGSYSEQLCDAQIECLAEGTTLPLIVSSNAAWQLSVQDSQDWVTATPGSGSGDMAVTVTVKKNTTAEERTAVIQFYSAKSFAKFTVKQAAGTGEGPEEPEDPEEPVNPAYTSISDVRALYEGKDKKITEDITISGVVISDFRKTDNGGLLNNYTSAKTIVISDGTTGLQLYCAADNTEFARGDKVEVKLKDQTLSVYNNGALQVNGIPLEKITKVGEEALVAKEITAAELVTGAYESVYVAVKDVQVTDEDKGKTFATSDAHASIAFESKTGEGFVLFTSKYATFKDEKVPEGSGTLKGIAGVFGDTYQIILSEKADIAGLTGERFSTGSVFTVNGVTTPIATSVSGDAGKIVVSVRAKDVEWRASSNNADFTLSKASGSNATEDITISYTDNPNTTGERTAVITFTTTASVANKTITVTITQGAFNALVSDVVNQWMELPKIDAKDGFAYISHNTELSGETVRNYSYWLDGNNRVANWVAYPLYKGIDANNTGRSDAWAYDPKVPKRCQPVLLKGWGISGIDRGHQLPSADRVHSKAANEATFYFTNMTAQNSSLNQGVWGKLETSIRNWANNCDTLYIVTGAVITTKEDSNIEYVKDNSGNNVAKPKAYFKAVLRYKKADAAVNGGYSAIGFWFKNEKPSITSVSATEAKTIKQIEDLTGFNFFHNLSDAVESAVEGEVKLSEWGL